MSENQFANTYKTAKGVTKYYTTWQGAWKAAIRLNATAAGGSWFFDADETGMWFLWFGQDK